MNNSMKNIAFLVLALMIPGFNTLVSQTITGTVSSARDGQTLPGVTIQIKGTMVGSSCTI